MTSHGTRRTKSRIFIILAILVVAYIVFDRGIEKYRKSFGSPQERAKRETLAKENMKIAPKWKLKNLTGESFKSEYLNGDVVLITFWLSTCPSCFSELPLLKELDSEYKDKGFKIVAISLDELEDPDLQAFVKGEQLNYIVLRGDSKITKQFGGIEVVPQSFLIDRKNHIVKYFLGPINKNEIERLIKDAL